MVKLSGLQFVINSILDLVYACSLICLAGTDLILLTVFLSE